MEDNRPAPPYREQRAYIWAFRKFIRGRRCLEEDPDCVKEKDIYNNNAMHVCVLGGIAMRMPQLMRLFLEETAIDLLQQNMRGMDVLDLAMALNDEVAAAMIEPHAHDQLNVRFPIADAPKLTPVPGRDRDPGSNEPSP